MTHAYTEVLEYGEHIAVVCDHCAYREAFPLIKQANAAARAHNASIHPEEP